VARARERGVALVSVLWGIAILSLIAAAMLAAIGTTARIDHNAWALTRAGAIADATVNRAVLTLLDSRPEEQGRVDGTPRRFSFDGVRATVWGQDETGKIDLNTAGADLLAGLFVSAGLKQDDANALADHIVKLRPVNASTNAIAFHTVDDLLNVPGVTPDLYARVMPALTVFSHNATIDTNVAPRVALLALPDMDGKKADDLIAQRNEAYEQGTATSPNVSANGAFAITVEVHVDNVRLVREVVVQLTGDKDKPFWFVSWK
jgi:general secretion pathway protein K